jgi:hypothetical protein
MPRKELEQPPEVRAFVRDMHAYFAAKGSIEADTIAARRLHALKQHYSSKLKLHDVKEMFVEGSGELGQPPPEVRADSRQYCA